MKTINILLSFFIFAVFSSCQKDGIVDSVKEPESFSIDKITGFVQKGPFIIGTSITVSEFDSTLSQTGRNFNTQIISNDGAFVVKNITLNNSIVQIKADGFYFNEVKGAVSENQLTLYAIGDLNDKSTINVNVLSYLEKDRIENLVESGKSFAEAKRQAQKEVLAIFEIEKENIVNSEHLDISKDGDDNAVLLAASVILQGNRSVAQLSELLAKISLDTSTDGVLDDQKTGSQLINDAKMLDLKAIRSNIDNKYLMLGEIATIPDFESKVINFITNTKFVFNLKIDYPIEGKYGRSLLSLDDGETIASPAHYSLKAILPQGFDLSVRVKQTSENTGNSWFYGTSFTGEVSPYELPTGDVGNMTWTTKKNVTDADNRISFEGKGSGIIEIFENKSEKPTRIIHFKWDYPKSSGLIFPASGKFGDNLLSFKDNSVLKSGQRYSLAIDFPSNMNIEVEFTIVRNEGSGTMDIEESMVENLNVGISEQKEWIYGNSQGAPAYADMPVTFSGKGECTVELKVRNGANIIAKLLHLKWE